jgi:hypothetical protein
VEKRRDLPRKLFWGFLAGDTFFLLAHFTVFALGLAKTKWYEFFGLNFEMNPPTWWSAAQFLVVALVFFVIAAWPFRTHPLVRPIRVAMIAAGVLFTYISADEAGVIHERVSLALKYGHGRWWYLPNTYGFPWWIFVWAAAIGGVVLLVVYLPRMWRLWRRETILLVVGFAFMIAGGAVIELVAEVLFKVKDLTPAFYIETGIEEWMEMVGATVALLGAARMLARVARDLYPAPAQLTEPPD